MTQSNATTWLLYTHVPNLRDRQHFLKSMRIMQQHLQKHVRIYAMLFGPTVKSDATLSLITSTHTQVLLTFPMPLGIASVEPCLKQFVSHLRKHQVGIDAIFCWCHGSGWALSPYKGWKQPFLPIDIFNKHLVRPFQCQFVVFDACFQGAMSSLYELDPCVRVVLAAPAFHPFTSLLQVPSFGTLTSFHTTSQWLRYADKMCCEWNAMCRVPYKCLLVFDMQYIPRIAALAKKHWNTFRFGNATQIDPEDANLHDLHTAAAHVPELQDAIQKSIHATCPSCRKACTSKVKGVSVEPRMPKKWQDAYIRTKWFRHVVGGQRNFN